MGLRMSGAPPIPSIRRVNNGILSEYERPVLDYLASRLPSSVSPNDLTLFGVFGAFLAAAGFWLSNWGGGFLSLAALGMVVNWFGDSLDGTVARLRNVERPSTGFFIDHTADLFSQVVIVLSLGASPYVHFGVASLMLAAYLAASVFTYVRLHALQVHYLSQHGLGPTELRLALVFGCALGIVFGSVNFKVGSATILAGDVMVACIAIGTFVSTFVTGAGLCLELLRDDASNCASESDRPVTIVKSAAE